MKKLTLILAVAAVSLLAFSCTKGGDDKGGDKGIVMKDGATKADAKVVKFNSTLPTYKDKTGNTCEVLKLELTEDKMCVVEGRVVATRANVGDIVNEVFSYAVSGGTYTINGFGTITISDNKVSFVPSGGEGGTYNATIIPTSTSSVAQNNFARTWKVSNILLSVTGKGVSIMKSFSGCNLEEIAKYAAENGVSGLTEHLAELKGYKVDYVMFTGANSYVISFTGANAIAGTFSLPSDGKLSFSFPEGNPFFHGSSNGSYEFTADKKVTVIMNETIEGYSGTLEMSLTAAY